MGYKYISLLIFIVFLSYGARLMTPIYQEEIDFLRNWVTGINSQYSGIYLGLNSLFSEGDFVSIEGKQLNSGLMSWTSGEPNNLGGVENCIVLRRNGDIRDSVCNLRLPFVCKAENIGYIYNDRCQTTDSGYFFASSVGSCYKFHVEPRNWTSAHGVCAAEGSNLAVINSNAEAQILKNIFSQYPPTIIYGAFDKNTLLLGFHTLFLEQTFRTIYDQKLVEAGYADWASFQPDDHSPHQHCGALLRDGRLDDAYCNQPYMFVCERPGVYTNQVAAVA